MGWQDYDGDYAYEDYMSDLRDEAYSCYDSEPDSECPECGEFGLVTGETRSFYVDGMKESPDETEVYCKECGMRDVI